MINSILSLLFSWKFIVTFTFAYLVYEFACDIYRYTKDRERASARLRREILLLQKYLKNRRSR